MGNRHDLNDMLQSIVPNVYFQPPESIKMRYPAIRYSRNRIEKTNADNNWYHLANRYTLILIYREADSALPMELTKLNKCKHVNHYVAENLYHDVFELEY